MNVLPGASVIVEAPASSANLGPGFDVLALALSLRLRLTVEAMGDGVTTLEVAGEGSDRLRPDASNRFLMALERGLAEAGVDPPAAWRVEMVNEIPLARGLGSSAAATVAGLMAAQAFSGHKGVEWLLKLAVEVEGHADNAAAALYGGFVVVGRDAASGLRLHRIEPPDGLAAAIFVPDRELATDRMRAVLPDTVPRADAIHNVSRTAHVVAAMAAGDLALLASMSDDRLHEPYRAAVYPEFGELKRAAVEARAFGAALSGAGSSVIALCRSHDAANVAAAMQAASRRVDLAGSARVIAPRSAGARRHIPHRVEGVDGG